MTDAPAADPYAAAKTNLRDTIKWLATSLAAVGAAVAAGASIGSLSALEGETLIEAAALAAAALALILLAIAVMLRLLTSNVFYFSSLLEPNNPIAAEINAHAQDVLSPQTPTIAALVDFRAAALHAANGRPPTDPVYQDAYRRYVAADASIARVTNLAQFLALRQDLADSRLGLFFLTLLIIACLSGSAILAGGKSGKEADTGQGALFTPGANWSAAAEAFRNACGADAMRAELLQKKAFFGWVAVRLEGPGKCAGLELSVPAALTKLTGAKR